MPLTIKTAETNADYDLWDTYALNHSEGTLFHLSQWKHVVEKTFGHKSHYLMALSSQPSVIDPQSSALSPKPSFLSPEETVVGILPMFQIKSLLFGHYWVSIPFAEVGGALADDASIRSQLIVRAMEIVQEGDCDYLELRNREPLEGLKTKDLYVNFKREIFSELDDNLMAIPRKARRMIRQGDKSGLSFEFGSHQIDDFYSIMCSSYRNLGTPIFPKQFFRNFIETFGNNCQLLVVRTKEGRPAAAVLSFFFKDQVLPYYAGSEFECRQLAPNDYMYWQLLKYGCEKGYKVFDYGRSKIDTGSYHFKRHWGFEPTPLAYQYHLVRIKELPNLSPTNPKYKKKIEAWRKLPLWATRMIGPPIAKYLA